MIATTQTSAVPTVTSTRRLLTIGALHGPVFLTVAGLQVMTRDGYDLTRHPLSMLSLGTEGWAQISNFVVSGLLAVAIAAGIRRVLHPGPAATAAPVLVGLYGIGMVTAGVFVADPALGFPPGAPAGQPDAYSRDAIMHGIAAGVSFLSLTLAALILARRFLYDGRRGWAIYSIATAMAAIALSPLVGSAGLSVRLALGATVTVTWATAVALRLRSRA